MVLLQVAANIAVGLLLCANSPVFSQRLEPVSNLRTSHAEFAPPPALLQRNNPLEADVVTDTTAQLFEQPSVPPVEFVLEMGELSGDLLTDFEFRQFESLIIDDQWNQRQELTTGFPSDVDNGNSQVEQVAYLQDLESAADGFSAMEQPRVEAFPPIAAEAEAGDELTDATAIQEQRHRAPVADGGPAVPTVGLPPVAAGPSIAAGPSVGLGALGQAMGPDLPESGSFDVPISEQEIGQLYEQIRILANMAKNETGDEQKRHLGVLEDARKSLAQANKYMWKDIKQKNKSKNFEQEKNRLMGQLEQVRQQQQPAQSSSADELFAQLEQLRAELEERNERLREINKSELQQKKRMEKIPEERNKAKMDLAENNRQMKEQESGDGNSYALVLIRARELELEYRIKALGSESKLHELENRLLPMRGDDLAREIKLLEIEIDAWNFAANEQRRKDIAEEVRLARLKAIEAAPALKTLANTNAQLIQLRAEFAEKIRMASEEDLEVQSELNLVKNHHETAEKSIVGSTFNEANGILMVDIRRQLPTPFRSRARIGEIEADLRKINLEQLELNEQRRPLAHPYEYVEQRLAGVVSVSMSAEELKKMALEFVGAIRQQYDQLSSDHHDYSELLRKIVAERKELVSEIVSTKKFVDEHTLWIQSAKSIGLDHLAKTRHGAREFFDPAQWYSLLDCLTTRMFRRPHESAVGLMGLVGLFVFSRRFKG